tara:strand:- start:179 stop:1039 length:861 start_codon:yes stop_codon:yes gene_type:complete
MSKSPKNRYPMSGKIEYTYNYKPKTSFIINYFTSVDTMIKTINNIRTLGDDIEIIVHNDRHGENTNDIMKVLTHRNDRMIISHDLGERRGYEHGAQISNATEYLIFCQDDDLAPNNNQWYLDCLKEFEKDKKLGMIGLLKGGCNYSQKDNITICNKYEKVYVSWLATGPLMIRKDVYEKVNGWSEEFSQIGEADGGADADLATKVLLIGYKSMLLRTKAVKKWVRRFERGDGLNNKTIKSNPNESRIMTNKRILLNNKIYFDKYKNKWNEIFNLIKNYNKVIGIKI